MHPVSKPGFLCWGVLHFFSASGGKKRQEPERQRETQKVKELMWTETRNSSHKPAEKQNYLCLAIYQLVVLFIARELQEVHILGTWCVCASHVAKGRGKRGQYWGERERGCRQSGTSHVLWWCKQERAERAKSAQSCRMSVRAGEKSMGLVCHPAFETRCWRGKVRMLEQ